MGAPSDDDLGGITGPLTEALRGLPLHDAPMDVAWRMTTRRVDGSAQEERWPEAPHDYAVQLSQNVDVESVRIEALSSSEWYEYRRGERVGGGPDR